MYPINNNSPNDQYLGGFPQLTPTQNKTISSQLEKTICKIHKLDGKNATGFLCKIPFPDNSNLMPVLITNNHVLNKEDIQLFKTIKVTLGNDKIEKYIKLDESRIVYTSSDESIDVTIIEIKPNIDGFKHFLDVDDKIFATNYVDVYQKKPVYILQYPQGKESSHSEGIINKINDKIIEHSCSVDFCSSGAPILKLSSFKVIGVHKKLTNGNVNEGTLIQFIINYFYDKYYNKKPSNNQKKNNNYNNKDPNQQYIGNNMRNFYEPDPDEKKTKIVKVDYPTFESNIFNVQENNNNQPNNNFNTPNNDFNNPKDDYNSPNNDFNTPNNDFNTPNNDFNKPNNDFNTPNNNRQNNNYNMPNGNYNPPNNNYNPPNNNYNPPNNNYNPQNNNYYPPNNNYNPPNNNYNPPNNNYVSPNNNYIRPNNNYNPSNNNYYPPNNNNNSPNNNYNSPNNNYNPPNNNYKSPNNNYNPPNNNYKSPNNNYNPPNNIYNPQNNMINYGLEEITNDNNSKAYNRNSSGGPVKSFAFYEYQVFKDKNHIVYKTIENFNGDPNKMLFCLFSGHGGTEVAQYLQEKFAKYMKKILPFKDTSKDLTNLFKALDEKIKGLNVPNVGATGTIVYIQNYNGKKKLYCANVGNNRCLLINRKGVIKLSNDHNINDPEEHKRILRKGGTLNTTDLAAKLPSSRSFGYWSIKKNGGIISDPHISVIDINNDDLYIIIGSEKVWKYFKNEDCLKVIGNKYPKEISKKITVEIMSKGCPHNVGSIVISFK